MKDDSYRSTIKYRRLRVSLCFVILIMAMAVVFLLSVAIGTVNVGISDIFSSEIVRIIRLPRTLMAAVLGGGLAVSGFLLQTYFSNPLAGPYVLGISSSAKVAVAVTMIFFIKYFSRVSSLVLIVAAFIGALSATVVILFIARFVNHAASLLLVGIMIGYVCSALCDFVVTFADDNDIVSMHDWSKGSFSGSSMDDVIMASVIIAVSLMMVMLVTKQLSALRLGEEYAANVGVNIRLLRRLIICISAVLSATVTAYAGPISFVGIAVPVLVRRIFATSSPAVIVPASFLGGALFCMICDLIARTAFSPIELSISSVTAILGAPVVIVTLLRRSRIQ